MRAPKTQRERRSWTGRGVRASGSQVSILAPSGLDEIVGFRWVCPEFCFGVAVRSEQAPIGGKRVDVVQVRACTTGRIGGRDAGRDKRYTERVERERDTKVWLRVRKRAGIELREEQERAHGKLALQVQLAARAGAWGEAEQSRDQEGPEP